MSESSHDSAAPERRTTETQRLAGGRRTSLGAGGARPETPLAGLQSAAGNAAVSEMLASAGQPLPAALRREMEGRFGQDFSGVRIHQEPRAADAARRLGARAFTQANHIGFAAGRFAPGAPDGKRLLGHELAHVVQQSRGGTEAPSLDGAGALEADAAQAAQSVASGDGAVAVAGAGAAGPAADPDPPQQLPWYERARRGASEAAAYAKSAYDDPKAALAAAQTKAGAAFDEYTAPVREAAADAKAAWDQSDVKKSAVAAVNQQSLEEELAEATKKDLPPDADTSPRAELARSAHALLTASAKLNAAPLRAAARALLDGHPIQAVEDAQKAADAGLKEMKAATFGTIDKWEDGKFQQPAADTVDPAAHPLLAKAEHGLNVAGEAVGKRQRQLLGGATKALYSMVEGIDSMVIHPMDTAEGLSKLTNLGSPIPSTDTMKEGAGFLRDLADPKISKKQALQRLWHAEKDKQDAQSKMSVEMLKGLGHNYVEAAGGEFVPPLADQKSPEQRTHFAGMTPGEINWKGWSGRERLAEIPGLLLVDVGSFFVGGGEANAATKGGRGASAAAKLGKTANVGGEAAKLGAVAEAGRGAEELGELGRIHPPAPGELRPVEPPPVASHPPEPLPPEPASAKPPAAEPPAAQAPAPVTDIGSARGRRYPPATQRALDEASKGAEVKPLREGVGAEPRAEPAAHEIPEAVPEAVAEPLAQDVREAAGAEGQAPRASASGPGPKQGPRLVQPAAPKGPGGSGRGAGGGGSRPPRGPPGEPPAAAAPGHPPPTPRDPLTAKIETMPPAEHGGMMEAVISDAEKEFYRQRYANHPELLEQVRAEAAQARQSGRITSELADVDRMTLERMIAEDKAGMPRTSTWIETPRQAGLGTEGSPIRNTPTKTRFVENVGKPAQIRRAEVAMGGKAGKYDMIQSVLDRPGAGGQPGGVANYLSTPKGRADPLRQGARVSEIRVTEAHRMPGGPVHRELQQAMVELGAEDFGAMEKLRKPPGLTAPPPAGEAVRPPTGSSFPERIMGTGDLNAAAGEGSAGAGQFRRGVRTREGVENLAQNDARRLFGVGENSRTLNRVGEEALSAGSRAGEQLAPVLSSYRDYFQRYFELSGGKGPAFDAYRAFKESRQELVNALIEMMNKRNPAPRP